MIIHIKRALKILAIVLLVMLLLYLGKGCVAYITYENTVEYRLHELEDGVYGYYNAVRSNIPAENYDMVIVCFGGNIFTLDGNINIHYTDSTPRIVWKDINVVHGDTFDVYVPYGSIIFRPNLVQS